MNGQSIVVQVGSLSNHIGSNLWNVENEIKNQEYSEYDAACLFSGTKRNVPRCIAIDYATNFAQRYSYGDQSHANASEVLWSGPTQVVERQSRKSQDSPHNRSERWIENMNVPLHAKSCMELSSSIYDRNFDSFFAGYGDAPNMSTSKFVDEALERMRYFAEECDYISNITIISDMDDGYAGLTCSLLPNIREEFGNSITIPVFGISYDHHGIIQHHHDHYHHSSQPIKSDILHRVQLPMIYGSLLTLSDMFCPIAMESVIDTTMRQKLSSSEALIWSSSVLAVAMDVMLSPMHYNTSTSSESPLNHRQWIDNITSRRSYPILASEASYPDAIDLSDANLELWPYHDNNTSSSSSSLEHRMISLSSKIMNPFLRPLSIFRRDTITTSPSLMIPYSQRAQVNSIFVHGPCRDDLSTKLFLKCLDTDYAVTSYHHVPASLCIPSRYPYINESSSVDYIDDIVVEDDFLCPTMAALGVDASIEHHLGKIASEWSQLALSPSALAAQLEVVGYSKDDRLDLAERLNQLHQMYVHE